MNMKRAIFRIKHELNESLNDGVTKDNLFEAIDKMKIGFKEGKKYKAMWEEFQLTYGYRTTYDELGENQLSSIDNILKERLESQTPYLMQPIWKTDGKKLHLKDNCLDIIMWSDYAR